MHARASPTDDHKVSQPIIIIIKSVLILYCREEVAAALNDAVELREEGLVIKRPDSIYRLNTRSNEGGWLKIKV